MPVATLESASLNYLLEGPQGAPVIVLSNSLGTDLTMWDSQIPALTKHFQVLRYDTRGHGGSSTHGNEYLLSDLGGDVLQLMDFLELDCVHVCGISLGGITALWLAIHTPHRLRSVMACNTAARIGTRSSWTDRIEQVRHHGLSSIADATMERWFTQSFRHSHTAQIQATRSRFVRTSPEGYMACCAGLRDADLTASVGSIAIPALVISGSHDSAIPLSDGLFLRDAIPAAHYYELDAAHLSNIEQPEIFLRAIAEFLSSPQQRY